MIGHWHTLVLAELSVAVGLAIAVFVAWRIDQHEQWPLFWIAAFGGLAVAAGFCHWSTGSRSALLATLANTVCSLGCVLLLGGAARCVGIVGKRLWELIVAVVPLALTVAVQSITCGAYLPCPAVAALQGLIAIGAAALLLRDAVLRGSLSTLSLGAAVAFVACAQVVRGFADNESALGFVAMLVHITALVISGVSVSTLLLERHLSRSVAQERSLRSKALTDIQTGMYTSRRFVEIANLEVGRASRYSQPLSLLVLDIDNYDIVSDTIGQDVAAKLLKAVSSSIGRSMRQLDVFGRIGTARFAAILPQTDLEAGERASRRMTEVITADAVQHSGGEVRARISVGVTAFDNLDLSADDMMARCLKALERAQTDGGGRIVVADLSD